MQRRATSKRRTEDPKAEEDKWEHETEAAVDTEREQPAGDKEEARGDLNLI